MLRVLGGAVAAGMILGCSLFDEDKDGMRYAGSTTRVYEDTEIVWILVNSTEDEEFPLGTELRIDISGADLTVRTAAGSPLPESGVNDIVVESSVEAWVDENMIHTGPPLAFARRVTVTLPE